jgi:hypothetical protein
MAPRLILVILAAKGLRRVGSPHALNANCVNCVLLVPYCAVCDRSCRNRGIARLAEDPHYHHPAMTAPERNNQ